MNKILIIEDDKISAELEKDYLELSDFSVEIENDSQKALKSISEGTYDLIILGLVFPKADGFDLCKKIRNKVDIPIIIVSSRKDEIDIVRGLSMGADDYITKPFVPSELVARVRCHIAAYERLVGRKSTSNSCLIIGDITIDRTARRVYVDGDEKIFTTKEFDLLTFLAQNPNHVFTKEDLFQKIWGMESVGDVATVTVHIKKIREKIEANTTKPKYIETIWGVGYRFKMLE